jgi:hypothetical protein
MSDRGADKGKPWCIVVADDHGPEYVPWMAGAAKTSPVQYCGFGEPTTLLQRVLHRAEGLGCCRRGVRRINSAALRFIRRDDMQAEGYGAYLNLVEDIK